MLRRELDGTPMAARMLGQRPPARSFRRVHHTISPAFAAWSARTASFCRRLALRMSCDRVHATISSVGAMGSCPSPEACGHRGLGTCSRPSPRHTRDPARSRAASSRPFAGRACRGAWQALPRERGWMDRRTAASSGMGLTWSAPASPMAGKEDARTQLETIYQLGRQAANRERLVTIRRAARCRIASARIAYNLTHSSLCAKRG